ncbi:MAG TPA: hypothetical protein VJU86_20345 [Pyrinomonadaceae bacterium]|nr:hypothetical protein [Pyrinomonadaceae bacterium]
MGKNRSTKRHETSLNEVFVMIRGVSWIVLFAASIQCKSSWFRRAKAQVC